MPPRKPTVEIKSTCKTCAYATRINGSTFVECAPDLPPMIQVSNNAAKHRVNENYGCVMHKVRPGVS